jgi:hypothetical protein
MENSSLAAGFSFVAATCLPSGRHRLFSCCAAKPKRAVTDGLTAALSKTSKDVCAEV